MNRRWKIGRIHLSLRLAVVLMLCIYATYIFVRLINGVVWNIRVSAVWNLWVAAQPPSQPAWSDDLIRFVEEGSTDDERRFGFRNADGEVVIPAQYRFMSERFSHGLARAADEEWRYGYIDMTGAWAIPPKQDVVLTDFLYEGVAEFEVVGLCGSYRIGYLRTDGTIVIPPVFTMRRDMHNGVVMLGRPGKWADVFWSCWIGPTEGLPFVGTYRLSLFDATGNTLTPGELRRRLKSAPQP